MKRYLSRALPIAAILVLLACSEAIRAQTPPPKDCTNPGPPCMNAITVNAANCNNSTVQYDKIRFPRKVTGNDNRKILVTWTLSSGYGFCPRSIVGDGVFLKYHDPDNQFTRKGFENASGSGPCNLKSVKVLAENSKEDREYPYRIQFHSSDGKTACTIDPTMVNE
jgi:hypothetical protein